jgi:hypothetical protein
MAEQDKQEAAEKAGRAARQMKHAASNAGDAVEAGAEYVKDEAVGAAEKGYSKTRDFVNTMITTEYTQGGLAVALGALSIVIGVKKIKNAGRVRVNLHDSLAKADHHIRRAD